MATEYALRMGDGKRVFLTKEKIMEEIEAGTANAADLGEIPGLNANEMDKLAEILMRRSIREPTWHGTYWRRTRLRTLPALYPPACTAALKSCPQAGRRPQ